MKKQFALCLIILTSLLSPAYAFNVPPMYGTSYDGLPFVQFELDANGNCEEGRLSWNADDATLNMGVTGNVCLQVGQEQLTKVRNNSGVTITDGSVVRVTGSLGVISTIGLANATTEAASSKTFGLATEDIPNNSNGYVTTFGMVRNQDTSSFATDDTLWLSTAPGQIQNTPATTPNHATFIGWVVYSHASEGKILVSVQNGFEWYELHDVDTINAIANDLAIFNGTAWTNTADIIVNSITYGNTYWEDKTISVVSTVLGPTAPDLETFIQNTLAFAWSDSVASEAVHLNVQTPHAKKLITDMEAHVHGNSGSNTNSGNVEAILECTDLVNLDGTFPNSTTILNGVAAIDGTAYKNYYIELGDIDGSAATKISALMQCRLTRNVSVAGDLTGDFFFLDVDFHYQIDTPGSETENAK